MRIVCPEVSLSYYVYFLGVRMARHNSVRYSYYGGLYTLIEVFRRCKFLNMTYSSNLSGSCIE